MNKCQFRYKRDIILFLKQIRLFWIVFSAGSTAAVTVIWYMIRFGEEFTKNCGFCDLDVFFFCLGNYPEEWENIWMADHYLIAILPFLILVLQLIFYVDINSCERMYYISFRRINLWKQTLHDFVGIAFIIVSWLFCFEQSEKAVFSFLYGQTGKSLFIGKVLSPGEEFLFLNCMIIRQAVVLVLFFIFAYGILFKFSLVWSATVMIGAVAASFLLGFTGCDSPFVLNAISTNIRLPLFGLLIMLLIVFSDRKYLKYIYLE